MRADLIALCLLFVAVNASAAGIYRWTDSQGRVQYGDRPPAGARDKEKIEKRVGASSEATEPAEETDPALAARSTACNAKRTQLSSYRNAVRLVETNHQGKEREYGDEEKRLLIARTEAEIGVLCEDEAAPAP